MRSLYTAKLLICPADTSKHLASNFAKLQSENAGYSLRTGPTINDEHPDELIVICPIHGNALHIGGRVEMGKKKRIDSTSLIATSLTSDSSNGEFSGRSVRRGTARGHVLSIHAARRRSCRNPPPTMAVRAPLAHASDTL